MADASLLAAQRCSARSLMRPGVALLGVVGLFGVLAVLIALKLPAWEAPDEPAHVDNVETLVQGRWYRIEFASAESGTGVTVNGVRLRSSFRTELHQPPLYYLLLAGWQKLAGRAPRSVDPGPISFPFVQHGLYRHHRPADHRFVLWLRLANVLLGIATIGLTFLAARLLTVNPWTPVIAAAIIAFEPRQVFLAAAVTNDNLVTLLGALLTYGALRSVTSSSRWGLAAVGGVIGLIILTKLSALPMALVLAVLVFSRRSRTGRVEAVVIPCAAALAVSGWYLIQNLSRYGDVLARHASQRYLSAISALGTIGPYHVDDPLRLVFIDVPEHIWRGFWYTSGAGNQFRWPWPATVIFWLALGLALAGLCARRRPAGAPDSQGTRRFESPVLAVLVALAVGGLLGVWIVAFSTGSYEARLAFGGLPAVACLAALGLERYRPPLRLVLPLFGLAGTLIAIQHDVLGVGWPS